MYELELHVHELEQARRAHELDALSVGLNYFDRDEKGAITASECPELSARLFDLLDTNKDGRISHDDLMRSVNNLLRAIDSSVERVRQLQREIDELSDKRRAGHAADALSVHIARNEAVIQEEKQVVEEKKRDLRAIFSQSSRTTTASATTSAAQRASPLFSQLQLPLRLTVRSSLAVLLCAEVTSTRRSQCTCSA